MIGWDLGVGEFVDFFKWEGETWNCACKEKNVCKCTHPLLPMMKVKNFTLEPMKGRIFPNVDYIKLRSI